MSEIDGEARDEWKAKYSASAADNEPRDTNDARCVCGAYPGESHTRVCKERKPERFTQAASIEPRAFASTPGTGDMNDEPRKWACGCYGPRCTCDEPRDGGVGNHDGKGDLTRVFTPEEVAAARAALTRDEPREHLTERERKGYEIARYITEENAPILAAVLAEVARQDAKKSDWTGMFLTDLCEEFANSRGGTVGLVEAIAASAVRALVLIKDREREALRHSTEGV